MITPRDELKVVPLRAIKKAVYYGALRLTDEEIREAVEGAILRARMDLSS